MNIKSLRLLLKDWGRYWAHIQPPLGFNKVSITAAIAEQAKTGIWSAGKRSGHTDRSDNIRQPEWVLKIDLITEALTPTQRRSLNLCYIKKHKLNTTEKIALLHAEVEIMARL